MKHKVKITRLNMGDYVAVGVPPVLKVKSKTKQECIDAFVKAWNCKEDDLEIEEVSKMDI